MFFLINIDPLAYMAAKTHGLDEEAEKILKIAEAEGFSPPPNLPSVSGELLKAPTPILKRFDANWPLLSLSKGFTEGVFTSTATQKKDSLAGKSAPAPQEESGWGDEEVEIPNTNGIHASHINGAAEDEAFEDAGGWDLEDELDLPIDDAPLPVTGSPTSFVPPVPELNASDLWCRNSGLAFDHAASGNFESAMQVF